MQNGWRETWHETFAFLSLKGSVLIWYDSFELACFLMFHSRSAIRRKNEFVFFGFFCYNIISFQIKYIIESKFCIEASSLSKSYFLIGIKIVYIWELFCIWRFLFSVLHICSEHNYRVSNQFWFKTGWKMKRRGICFDLCCFFCAVCGFPPFFALRFGWNCWTLLSAEIKYNCKSAWKTSEKHLKILLFWK